MCFCFILSSSVFKLYSIFNSTHQTVPVVHFELFSQFEEKCYGLLMTILKKD